MIIWDTLIRIEIVYFINFSDIAPRWIKSVITSLPFEYFAWKHRNTFFDF